MDNLILITHRLFYGKKAKYGGGDIIVGRLRLNTNVDAIEHDLSSIKPTMYLRYDDRREYRVINLSSGFKIFRWAIEILLPLLIIKRKKYKYCLSTDPLCGLSCLLLKFFGKADYVLNHVVDYSECRFDSKAISWLYSRISFYVANNSNITTVVSKRIEKRFIDHGVNREKIMYFPNSIPYRQVVKNKNKIPIVCMTAKHVSDDYDYLKLLMICSVLKNDGYVFCVKIFGEIIDQDYYDSLKKYIKNNELEGCIEFLGYVSSDIYTKILIKSSIGVTFYNKRKTGFFAHYGDSLKIREYAAYGLPVITENIYETAIEGSSYGCTFICNSDNEYIKTFKYLLDGNYKNHVEDCNRWAKQQCKQKYLDKYEYFINKHLV